MAIRIPIISSFNAAGIEKAKKQFEQLKTSGERAQFALQKAAIPAGLALAGIGTFLVKAAKGAEEARIANQKLGNVLAGMGFAEATDRVSAFAESLEKTVAVDADVIKATQTVLGTFGELTKSVNVAGGAFDRATVAALDLAAAGFGTAESNAVQLGKALQDPIKGLAALAKSGVSFTEQEQAKIKALVASNNLLAAQDIVLKGIEKQVGGTAAASASSFDKMKFSLAGIADTFGEMVLPAIDKFAIFLGKASTFVQENKTFVGILTIAVAGLATTLLIANVAIKAQAAALVLMKVAAVVATAINFALATSITAVQLATGLGIAVVAAATLAMGAYMVAQNKLRKDLDATTDAAIANANAIAEVIPTTFKLNGELNRLARQHKFESEARLASVGALDKFNEAAKKTTTSTGTATQAVVEFASKVKEGLQDALKTAQDKLKDAQQVFNDFAKAVATGVKVGLSFSAAYQLMQAAAENAGKSSEDLTKAQTDLAKAISKGDVDEITKAQQALTEAQQKDAAAAKENKETFLGRLAAQVKGVKDYADNLQTLLARGLSQDALRHIIDAGGEAGAAIAAELVLGSTDLISGEQGINALVQSANDAADALGINAATKFYQTGLDQAQNIVDGLDDKLKLLTPKLMERMDKIAASLKRTVDVTVRITEVVQRIIGGAPITPRELVGSKSMAGMGLGGSSQFRQNSQPVTVNVMGGMSTSAEIGQAVVNAIRAYNRSAGPANIQVA